MRINKLELDGNIWLSKDGRDAELYLVADDDSGIQVNVELNWCNNDEQVIITSLNRSYVDKDGNELDASVFNEDGFENLINDLLEEHGTYSTALEIQAADYHESHY